MLGWSLLQVSLALSAHRTINYLLKHQHQICLVPRIDLSDSELWLTTAPNHIQDVDELLEYELMPLSICILKKDNKMLTKLWRQSNTWDSCHFYRLIELFNEHKDEAGLQKFLYPVDKFITPFFEPSVLEQVLEQSEDMTQTFKEKLAPLFESYKQHINEWDITSWDEVYSLEASRDKDWDDKIWNSNAPNSDHEAYQNTISDIKHLALEYGIETDLEQCSITPLHFIFAKYI